MSRVADASGNPSGTTLKELVDADPEGMLGAEHVKKHGPVPRVLVKLIDSSERLTIQTHPDKAHAKSLFHSDYGKTECWHILGGRVIGGEAPCVYLGFKEGITRARWKALFDAQDISGMLAALHRFDIQKGETILIEGGVPHAIGAGCFLVEIQEPTDFTIRIERVTPSGFPVADSMCHQGIGFEKMFDCFTYEGVSREEARARWFIQPTGESLITYERCPYFRLDRIEAEGSVTLPPSPVFSGIYAIEGGGVIELADGRFPLEQGCQYFLPAGAPELTIRGALTLLRFFGPKIALSD